MFLVLVEIEHWEGFFILKLSNFSIFPTTLISSSLLESVILSTSTYFFVEISVFLWLAYFSFSQLYLEAFKRVESSVKQNLLLLAADYFNPSRDDVKWLTKWSMGMIRF